MPDKVGRHPDLLKTHPDYCFVHIDMYFVEKDGEVLGRLNYPPKTSYRMDHRPFIDCGFIGNSANVFFLDCYACGKDIKKIYFLPGISLSVELKKNDFWIRGQKK